MTTKAPNQSYQSVRLNENATRLRVLRPFVLAVILALIFQAATTELGSVQEVTHDLLTKLDRYTTTALDVLENAVSTADQALTLQALQGAAHSLAVLLLMAVGSSLLMYVTRISRVFDSAYVNYLTHYEGQISTKRFARGTAPRYIGQALLLTSVFLLGPAFWSTRLVLLLLCATLLLSLYFTHRPKVSPMYADCPRRAVQPRSAKPAGVLVLTGVLFCGPLIRLAIAQSATLLGISTMVVEPVIMCGVIAMLTVILHYLTKTPLIVGLLDLGLENAESKTDDADPNGALQVPHYGATMRVYLVYGISLAVALSACAPHWSASPMFILFALIVLRRSRRWQPGHVVSGLRKRTPGREVDNLFHPAGEDLEQIIWRPNVVDD